MRAIARWINRNVLASMGIRVASTHRPLFSRTYGAKLLYFERLLAYVQSVPEDIVECGVAGGGTLILFATLNANSDSPRHIYGFDSFEGLPAPTREDVAGSKSTAREGMFKTSEESVWRSLRQVGFDDRALRTEITLVKGLLVDTLPQFRGQVALLHCDVDLYESTKTVLETLWPRVTTGGIVTFDEYRHEDWPGVEKAVDEYFSSDFEQGTAELHHDPFAHRSYVIKRT